MRRRSDCSTLDLGLVAPLLLGVAYLGLLLFLGTTSPFLIVQGTSMEPTFHAGDLLLARNVPAKYIRTGDIIAFKVPPEERERLELPLNVAHRVMAVNGDRGQLVFVTRGDNSGADPFPVPSSQVRGVVLKNLGPLARPVLLIPIPKGLFLFGLPLMVFIIIVLIFLWLTPLGKGKPVPEASAVTRTDEALDRFAEVIAKFEAHWQSDVAVVKNLREATEELRMMVVDQGSTAEELKQAVRRQDQVLEDLEGLLRGAAEHPAGRWDSAGRR
jgi:signal peptidase I